MFPGTCENRWYFLKSYYVDIYEAKIQKQAFRSHLTKQQSNFPLKSIEIYFQSNINMLMAENQGDHVHMCVVMCVSAGSCGARRGHQSLWNRSSKGTPSQISRCFTSLSRGWHYSVMGFLEVGGSWVTGTILSQVPWQQVRHGAETEDLKFEASEANSRI